MTVIDWLLDSDPAIRWQVMRDLTHEPADVIAAEGSKVATQGWGANVAKQAVREIATSFAEFAFEAAMSQDSAVSANALMEMGHAETRLAERTGELVLASFRAE